MNKTTLEGARALCELLDEAPEWLPEIPYWEIAVPTDADPRHVLGELPTHFPGVHRTVLQELAEATGGTYEEYRSSPDSACVFPRAHFDYCGVQFTVWAMLKVIAGGSA